MARNGIARKLLRTQTSINTFILSAVKASDAYTVTLQHGIMKKRQRTCRICFSQKKRQGAKKRKQDSRFIINNAIQTDNLYGGWAYYMVVVICNGDMTVLAV